MVKEDDAMAKILKVGDEVMWSGGFGSDNPRRAKVETIEVCEEGEKYGEAVDSVPWEDVQGRNIVVTLSTGRWAYGSQLSQIR